MFDDAKGNAARVAPGSEKKEETEVGLAVEAYEAIPPLVPGEGAEKDMNLRNQFAEFCSIDRSPGSLAGWR